ncbi:AIPR family protein [Actinoplanes sp. NPDC051633]|uniref:AIPR family protein n=1 Tax=Actinoplanes sp. NPDC051633 TaxID=3155670 RepID=UPI003433B844
MEIYAFRAELLNQAQVRGAAEGIFTKEAFLAEVADRLADAGDIEQLNIAWFEGEGKRRRKLAVHAYDLDDADNSVALAVLRWGGGADVGKFNYTEATATLRSLESFLEEAVSGEFVVGREESSPVYQLAEDLRRRGNNVSRYRLYLLSDQLLSTTSKVLPSSSLNGVPVDFHIWDIRRFFQVSASLTGRDQLVIDLTTWVSGGLPALEVIASSDDARTYLAALPATMLAELYDKHGSRLLEGNVRSYLSNRGKVNKGIRTTVLSDPAHFLAYNNGITATAVGVKAEDGRIQTVTDLQIVNGGQTTASLFYVRRENKTAPMDDVYVQMKLVVVEPAAAADMIPRISRFANSQNRVSEADFFSNSPFHVRLEELSRRTLAPSKAGVNYQTIWFYERTRGSYQNERNKLTPAKQRKFDELNPKSQMIDKTTAAKYEVSWGMQPHQVSSGAQKNFAAFANLVASRWETAPDAFNELYWKNLVAKGLLFEHVRTAIAKAEWYQKGYLANYVTYTVAKLAYEVGRQARGREFNLEKIWASQSVPQAVIDECLAIGIEVQGVLTADARPVQNVTEWAKKPDCWTAVQKVEHSLSPAFLAELDDRIVTTDRRRTAASIQKIDTGISAQVKVYEIQPPQWVAVEEFLRSSRQLSPTDASILDLVTGRKPGVPSEAQSRRLLGLLQRAAERGFRGDDSVD